MNSNILQTISQKLQQANRSSLIEKRREREEADHQLAMLEKNLEERRLRENQELEHAREEIGRVNDICDHHIKATNAIIVKQAEAVRGLKEEIEFKIEAEHKEHQDSIEKILEKSQEKIGVWAEETEKKAKMERERGEAMLSELSKKILHLQKQFKEQSDMRKQNGLRLSQEIQNEVNKFKLILEREKERRKSVEQKINSMIDEVQNKLKTEITNQSSKRAKNNESILKLIEVACQKLQQGMNQ